MLDATALMRLVEAQVVQGMAGLSKEQPDLIFYRRFLIASMLLETVPINCTHHYWHPLLE
jgi:hypothetical protein